ncbi:hypothetical protein PybrP1_002779 [[Pythium] brassicae (nom. inval.)]|nr:hypothetical protein PybrP1_002779 [[Pythium] brassicae (nom. inval.)]
MTAPAREQSPLATAPCGDKVLIDQVRVNGLQRPLTRDQLASWLGHGLSAACFYAAAITLLARGQHEHESGLVSLTFVALAVHVPTLALLLVAWISCERIDPSEALTHGWLGIKLRGSRWEKSRYCALCKKNVPGLDHHCTWLQTCIGKANYVQFFTIACAGSLQFLSQTLYASLCLAWLYLPATAHAGSMSVMVQGALAACLLISAPCMVLYFILLGFHVWLTWLGYGTYEWMLRRRRQKSAARKAREEMRQKKDKQFSGPSDNSVTDCSGSDVEGGGNCVMKRAASDSIGSSDGRRHISSVGSESHFVTVDDDPSNRSIERTAL